MTPAVTVMPEPWRRTLTDSPVSAAWAPAPWVPGHTRNEYCAYDCALSSGPGRAAGDAPGPPGVAAGADEAAAGDDGPAARARRSGPGLAADEGLVPVSVPGASPAWRPDQPCTARTIPVTAGAASSACPSRPARLPVSPSCHPPARGAEPRPAAAQHRSPPHARARR